MEIVRFLLDQLGSASESNRTHWTGEAMRRAAGFGQAEVVRFLSEKLGTVEEINKKDRWGMSARDIAHSRGHTKTVRELDRALMNAQDADGSTALVRAVQDRDLAKLKGFLPLLEAGDFERMTSNEMTLFHESNDPQIVQQLWSKYYELNEQRTAGQAGTPAINIALLSNKLGWTVIGHVAALGLGEALKEVLSLAPSCMTEEGQSLRASLMLLAAELGHVEVLEALLDEPGVPQTRFARINFLPESTGMERITPFMAACRSGHLEAARLMLSVLQDDAEKNSILNGGQDDGYTPLMFAWRAANEPVAEWLIGQGADLQKRDKYGNRADDLTTKKCVTYDEGSTTSMPMPIDHDEILDEVLLELEAGEVLPDEGVAG